ncbi:Asparagine synthetase [Caenispirillum salinarum AK4]|uniref:asparagine synthase (glutamine-hydrolyzing) n=1 Tax=Caenispirillum salinarum AK4 TaxID=1238182 RepID=K9HTY4_9PROT|nr:asparagine synthase (glutamine-hydrolyzing) [Caenispirillum salinarum]EKV31686.1 Asparagine synthetase [Caenispirillum salinarum AK4]
MCGIAGAMTRDGSAVEPALLNRMADALAHRGPDGSGVHLAGDVGLAHARLAIIDLDGGDQPLFGPDDALALVANGEIYNYRELRADLAGEVFRTGSDCEPPLALYRRRGLAFTDVLRGMYAIALHDPAEKRLVLARDPFGIKPLYYAETETLFAFASEPAVLIAAGIVPARVNDAKRDELFGLQFTTGADTAFQGIRRVLPGETLVVEAGRITEKRRLNALPPPDTRPAARDGAAAVKLFDRLFAESVDLHQRADVPYGMFLSGGVDSSAVLAMMARLNPDPVLAFTAGFPGSGAHDERDHARAVARAAGAEHVEVTVTEEDFWAHLPEIAAAVDDPCADYAIVPTWLLAREARASVKVILSGEGGDELFGGYGRYRGAMRPWPFTKAVRRKGMFEGLGVLRREAGSRWRDGFAAAEDAAARSGWRSRLQRAQVLDMADWLPHDLLTKLDRCLMAHGMEGRVPFLDVALAAFAMPLPDRLKMRGRHGKWVVKQWLSEALPVAQPFTPKRGFTVPVGEWIAAKGAMLGPMVAAQPGVVEAVDPEAARHLFTSSDRRARFAAWTLLYYALWYRRHVLGRPPAGDVFETLTTAP